MYVKANAGIEAFVAAESVGVIDRGLVLQMAEAMLAQSPYHKEFGTTMPWVYIDDYAWYVLAYLKLYAWGGDDRFLAAAVINYDWQLRSGGIQPGAVAASTGKSRGAAINGFGREVRIRRSGASGQVRATHRTPTMRRGGTHRKMASPTWRC